MTETSTLDLPSNPIPVFDFRRLITAELSKVSERRRNFIDDEFNSLEELDRSSYTSRAELCSVSLTRDNVMKNRYMDVLPRNDTRVKLGPKWARKYGDFINANYIDGKSLFGIDTRNYIATQGPKNETIQHFWAMILENKCPVILSLTRLKENGTTKCARYWPNPEEGKMQMDNLVVLLENQTYMGEGQDIVKRTFTVECKEEGETHTVIMFHFEAWPDHGIPTVTDSFRLLLREMNDHLVTVRKERGVGDVGPVCVHCSAGVGRTGTFISVDVAVEQLKSHQVGDRVDRFDVNVQNIVAKLKNIRSWMVQRRPQYVFAYRVLAEEWLARGL